MCHSSGSYAIGIVGNRWSMKADPPRQGVTSSGLFFFGVGGYLVSNYINVWFKTDVILRWLRRAYIIFTEAILFGVC